MPYAFYFTLLHERKTEPWDISDDDQDEYENNDKRDRGRYDFRHRFFKTKAWDKKTHSDGRGQGPDLKIGKEALKEWRYT